MTDVKTVHDRETSALSKSSQEEIQSPELDDATMTSDVFLVLVPALVLPRGLLGVLLRLVLASGGPPSKPGSHHNSSSSSRG